MPVLWKIPSGGPWSAPSRSIVKTFYKVIKLGQMQTVLLPQNIPVQNRRPWGHAHIYWKHYTTKSPCTALKGCDFVEVTRGGNIERWTKKLNNNVFLKKGKTWHNSDTVNQFLWVNTIFSKLDTKPTPYINRDTAILWISFQISH